MKVEPRRTAQRQFHYCFRGYCEGLVGFELDSASDLSVSQPRLQQEFEVARPAAPHGTSCSYRTLLECAPSPSISLLYLPHTHTCTLPTYVPAFFLFIYGTLSCPCCLFLSASSPFSSPNGRIPSWGLVLPYQGARTSLTQTVGIQLWWCQMCCQMDRPLDDSCKLTTITLM